MRAGQGGPLFVCHANCCRSVLACYLYRHLCNEAPALSAGLEVGERISDRAEQMLREWGTGELEVGLEHLHGVAGAALIGL